MTACERQLSGQLGPTDLHPYSALDIPSMLFRRVQTTPESLLLTWHPYGGEKAEWTYSDFWDEVQATARGLLSHGVRAGDHVIIHLTNRPEFLFAWFACALIGAVAVTTNTRSSAEELNWFALRTRAVMVITEQDLSQVVREATGSLDVKLLTEPSLLAVPGQPLPLRNADPLARLSIQFTSGTTARPKGVVWSHANGLWCADVSASNQKLTAQDRLLIMMPLFHTNALGYSFLAALWAGASIALLPKFSPSRFWNIAVEESCTVASAPAFLMRALSQMETPKSHKFRLWGSAVSQPQIAKEFEVPVVGWWGMTETVAQPIIGHPNDLSAAGTMGRVSTRYQARVVAESGLPVRPGETGNLQIQGKRGLSLFQEYLEDPEATSAAFSEDGWFDTGDLVKLELSGCLSFADRAKDMLRVGGENVAASEIERIILGVPGVLESAVVGAPHHMLDEVPVAFVVLSEPKEEEDQAEMLSLILLECGKNLADFKVPRAVEFVPELPRHIANKIDKKLLRVYAGELVL